MADPQERADDDTNTGENAEASFAPGLMLEAISQLLVATRSRQSPGERRYANEFAGRILAEMPPAEVVKAAELISKTSNPPEELQRQLIFSSPEAAGVVLKSRSVTDAVMMEAASKSLELRKIIAARQSLSEPVVNRLLFFEETEIENMLLPRSDVSISASRARRLIDRVQPDTTLGWLLSKRTDISTRHALRLFWAVGAESRAIILKRFNVNPTFAGKIVTQMMGEGMIRNQYGPLAQLAGLVARAADSANMAEPAPHVFQALSELRSDPSSTSARKVADAAHISLELAEKIMRDETGEAYAILAAALGTSEKKFRKLLSVNPPKASGLKPFTKEMKDHLGELADSLDPASAIAILSYWEIDFQDRRRERFQEKLEAELTEIQRRFDAAYSEAGTNDDAPEEDAGKDEPKPERKRRRLFG